MLLRNGLVLALVGSMLFLVASARQEDTKNTATVTKVETKELDAEVVYKFDRGMGAGRIRKAQGGRDGYIKKTFEVTLDTRGKEIARKLVTTERVEPVHTVFLMGSAGHNTSRGSFTRSRYKVMNSTAYTPSAGLKHPTFRTATGRRAQFGVIAVDPRVIKLNTLVFVEGYGFAIAADTGGAIKGNIIDVCLPTESQCRQWGRRKVKVHVFNERG